MRNKLGIQDGGVNVDDGGRNGKTTEQSGKKERSKNPTFKKKRIAIDTEMMIKEMLKPLLTIKR